MKTKFKSKLYKVALMFCTGIIFIFSLVNYILLDKRISQSYETLSTEGIKSSAYNVKSFFNVAENTLTCNVTPVYNQFLSYKEATTTFEQIKAMTYLKSRLNMFLYSSNIFDSIAIYDKETKKYIIDSFYSNEIFDLTNITLSQSENLSTPFFLKNNLKYLKNNQYSNIIPLIQVTGNMVIECFIDLHNQNFSNEHKNENLFLYEDNTFYSLKGNTNPNISKNIENTSYMRHGKIATATTSLGQWRIGCITNIYKVFNFWKTAKILIGIIPFLLIIIISLIIIFPIKKIMFPFNSLYNNVNSISTIQQIKVTPIFKGKNKLSKHLNNSSLSASLKLFFYILGFTPLILLTVMFLLTSQICITWSVKTSMSNTLYHSVSGLESALNSNTTSINSIITLDSVQNVFYKHYGLTYKYASGTDQEYIHPKLIFSNIKNDIVGINKNNEIIDNYILLDDNMNIIEYSNSNYLPNDLKSFINSYSFHNNKLYYLKTVISAYKTKYPHESEIEAKFNRKLGYMLFTMDLHPFNNIYTTNLFPKTSYFLSYKDTIVLANDSSIVGEDLNSFNFNEKNIIFMSNTPENNKDFRAFYIQDKIFLNDYYEQMFLINLLLFVGTALIIYILSKVLPETLLVDLKSITKQINDMVDLKELETKNLHENEIQNLALAFNNMIDRIDKLILQGKEQQLEINKLELAKKQAELIAFQSQVDPHFLYNAFANVSMMIQLGKTENAMKFLSALANMLKLSLFRNQLIVPLHEEIQHAEAYIKVQKMRFNDKISVVLNVDKSLLNCPTLKLILQPIIENTFNHGLEPKGKGMINIDIYSKNEYLIYQIKDNGVGLTKKRLEEVSSQLKQTDLSKHFGLGNINQRIKLNFGEKYGLTISSVKNSGTIVTVILPLQKEINNEELIIQ